MSAPTAWPDLFHLDLDAGRRAHIGLDAFAWRSQLHNRAVLVLEVSLPPPTVPPRMTANWVSSMATVPSWRRRPALMRVGPRVSVGSPVCIFSKQCRRAVAMEHDGE